jgi:hypothetical protein
MWLWLPILLLVAALLLVMLIVWLPRGSIPPAVARRLFTGERNELQARFFAIASHSGKPRGLRWKGCEWSDAVEFARDRQNGQLLALAGVTISFEAIEGSDMEGLAAVGNLRNASAVFFFDGNRWTTAGRTVFNLNPDEAIQHFGEQYERIEP